MQGTTWKLIITVAGNQHTHTPTQPPTPIQTHSQLQIQTQTLVTGSYISRKSRRCQVAPKALKHLDLWSYTHTAKTRPHPKLTHTHTHKVEVLAYKYRDLYRYVAYSLWQPRTLTRFMHLIKTFTSALVLHFHFLVFPHWGKNINA